MNNKGLTLIELIALLVIIGIISTIAVFTIGNTINDTRIQVDSYNLITLNLVTSKYASGLTDSVDDIFDGLESNEERMEALVQAGYLYEAIEVQQNSASFSWNISSQLWVIEGGDTEEILANVSMYDFSVDNLETLKSDGAILSSDKNWDFNDEYLETSSYAKLYIPINQIEYTITVEASISSGTRGGYGIYFETTLSNDNPSKESGYVLQFDRGYTNGAILLRTRIDGVENSPVWQIRSSNTDLFPSNIEDPIWWASDHVIKIQVLMINETRKEATFYIDDIELGSYIIETATSGEAVYTGFRVWATTASFYSLEIE